MVRYEGRTVVKLHVNGELHEVAARPARPAAGRAEGAAGPHRGEARMPQRRLRRLHGRGGRVPRKVLPDARGGAERRDM